MEFFIQALIVLSTAWIAIAILVPFLAGNKTKASTTLTTSEKWRSKEYRIKRLKEKRELDKTWLPRTEKERPKSYEDIISKAIAKKDIVKTASLIRGKKFYQKNPNKLDEVIVELYTA